MFDFNNPDTLAEINDIEAKPNIFSLKKIL